MMTLLQRLHRAVSERLASRLAKIIASLMALVVIGAVALPIFSTALSLQAQRAGILNALLKCSAKDRDPAAMQLLQLGTVTVDNRTYGGARVVGRALDLFDDNGSLPADVKSELSWRLLADQVPLWMPYALVRSPVLVSVVAAVVLSAVLATIWLGFLLIALEVAGALAALCGIFWWMGWIVATQWLLSASLAFLMFAFLGRAARALINRRSGALAVAANTALEGIRTLAAPGFALPISMILPGLALSREPGDPLFQTIPGFLDWGHTATYTFAALFAIFFGCASTAFEIRDRQVWSVVTKPLSAAGWLLGKWIGTLALGLSLAIGGGFLLAIGTSFLISQKPIDERDAKDVRNTVLVGRVGTLPQYEALPSDRIREIIDQAIEADSVLKADIANGSVDEGQSRRSLAAAKQREFLEQQRRIGPGESREFTFLGLRSAALSTEPITLRFKLHGGGEDDHQKFPAMIQYVTGTGGGMWELREWTPAESYSLLIDPKFIDENGTLKIRIFSAGWDEEKKQPLPSPITIFVQDDSLEVMVNDSTFTGNLISAITVDGSKLAFLSALAVVSGALLSFPIAVLLTFGVFAMATLAPFLAVSIKNYYPDEKSGMIIWIFQQIVLAIASAIEFMLRGFSARSPSDALAQGRSITWAVLFQTVFGIGVAWTGGVLLIGWLGIRRKEIAVYSGQG